MANKRKIFKKILLVLGTIIAVLICVVAFLCLYEPHYNGLIKMPSQTLVFSHRGFGDYAPDNSLIAAETAMKNGLDGVDMDAQLTSDKEIVIFHDLSVDRLTTSTGRVTSKTLKEMESLDQGIKFGKGFKDVFVKTFEDYVNNITDKGILMVELKVTGTEKTGIEERAAEIIKKHNTYDKVYLSSFNPIVLYRLKKIDPKIHTVFIFMDTNWNAELLKEIKPGDEVNLPWFLRNELTRRLIRNIIKPDALSVNNEVKESTINTLIAKGYPIFLWTVDSENRIHWALDKKPYGIISNEPLLAKKLRDESK
jgi:glycerophosphoryl diester phosphodiesterase